MISILGDYSYTFPQPIPLKLKLKDMLENNVDEKYYLSDKMLKGMMNTNFEQYKLENKLKDTSGNADTIVARFDGCPQLVKDKVLVKEATKQGYAIAQEGDSINTTQPNSNTRRGAMAAGMKLIQEDNMKTQLCNNLIQKGIVKENDVIKHSYTSNKLDDKRLVPTHNISPTLDTRCDCLGVVDNLRIRKLTPREAFRLMGVKDEDYERIAQNQSNSSLYHLAGDSIVVNVLMAIFGELLNIDWRESEL